MSMLIGSIGDFGNQKFLIVYSDGLLIIGQSFFNLIIVYSH